MNSEERAKILHQILFDLKGITREDASPASVFPGNGPDETMIVGSVDSLLKIAQSLIQTAVEVESGIAESEDVCDERVFATNDIKNAFNELAPIWPMCVYIVASDDAASRLATKIADSLGQSSDD